MESQNHTVTHMSVIIKELKTYVLIFLVQLTHSRNRIFQKSLEIQPGIQFEALQEKPGVEA